MIALTLLFILIFCSLGITIKLLLIFFSEYNNLHLLNNKELQNHFKVLNTKTLEDKIKTDTITNKQLIEIEQKISAFKNKKELEIVVGSLKQLLITSLKLLKNK